MARAKPRHEMPLPGGQARSAERSQGRRNNPKAGMHVRQYRKNHPVHEKRGYHGL